LGRGSHLIEKIENQSCDGCQVRVKQGSLQGELSRPQNRGLDKAVVNSRKKILLVNRRGGKKECEGERNRSSQVHKNLLIVGGGERTAFGRR